MRHDRARGRADVGAVGVDRHLAPAEDVQALLGGDALDVRDAALARSSSSAGRKAMPTA